MIRNQQEDLRAFAQLSQRSAAGSDSWILTVDVVLSGGEGQHQSFCHLSFSSCLPSGHLPGPHPLVRAAAQS